MKARNSSQQPLYLLLLVLACTWSAIEAAPDVCRYFANNTIIRDPDDCSHAIKCVDFKPTSHLKCKGTTPFFNKDTLKCVKELDDHSTCAIDCTEKAQNFLADPKSCTGYYYCFDDELAMRGDCPVGMHFNETQQMCLYQYKSECRVELFDFCSIVKNDVFFNDESACDAYFYCKKGNFTSAKCKSKYYDPVLGECVQKSQIDCPVHPLPTDVCGTVKKPLKNQFVGDEATCRGYYYCKDLGSAGPQTNPLWQVCPENTFFQKSTQSCANPLQVKCDEDRCDGRTLPFVVSGDKGCRDYLRCSNGRTIQKLSCGNYFFNEEQQHCTGMVLQYPACV